MNNIKDKYIKINSRPNTELYLKCRNGKPVYYFKTNSVEEYNTYSRIYPRLTCLKNTVPVPLGDGKYSAMQGRKLSWRYFKYFPNRWVTKRYFKLTADWLKQFQRETHIGFTYIDGVRIPLSSVHGDYDHWNILISGNHINIIDWEESQEEGLPFQDALYLVFHYADAYSSIEEFFSKKWSRRLACKFFKDVGLTNKMLLLYNEKYIKISKNRNPNTVPILKQSESVKKIIQEIISDR